MCQSKAQGGKRCPIHTAGGRAMLATIRAQHDLDRDQAAAVFRKSHAKARANKTPPTQAKWDKFLTEQIHRLALDYDVQPADFDRAARLLNSARAEIPDAQTFAGLKELDERATKAVSAVRRQVAAAAALRGVSHEEVAERFHAYRAQYLTDLRRLPSEERPTPPDTWVTGFTTKDMMAVSAPTDPATLYAVYRCQADPDAFQADTDARYASIDLETAGPAGKEGFAPENGSIIEVGIIEYDADGVETDRYSQLIAPDPDVAQVCGTGAVEVHGITMADVADAPSWATVAPEVAPRLSNRIMMAQNARFERTWLGHHMTAQDQEFDPWGPTVDTMSIAQQHAPDLPNHRLSTICESLGVSYTDGHRALHDAEVAGQAFFALRRRIFADYSADPVRARTPQPARTPARSPQRKVLTRLSAADFNPTTVVDPWATPTLRPAPAASSVA